MERLDEYRTHNSQFCKRIYDFLSIMFTAQVNTYLSESSLCGLKALLSEVQNAFGRYGWDEQTEWTCSTVLEGPPRNRDLSWSLQWFDPLSEGNGRKRLRQIMCRESRCRINSLFTYDATRVCRRTFQLLAIFIINRLMPCCHIIVGR